MKKVLLVILICLWPWIAFAVKLASLPDMSSPSYLAVDDDRFYIVDGCKIKIYSQQTFKLEKEFGNQGEGPQEFKVQAGGWGIMVVPLKDQLVVNSPGKVAFYSKNGDFIKEIVGKSQSTISRYQPVGNHYTGLGRAMENGNIEYITLNLYDEKLQKVKEIFRQKLREKGITKYPLVPPIFYVMDERIIKADAEKFIIYLFDEEGNITNRIKQDYKPLKVTDSYRDAVHHFYKTSPLYRDQYHLIKDRIQFHQYFPPIRYIFTADHNIYVLTFKQENGKNEFFIFDKQGKLLKKTYISVNLENVLIHTPAAIKNGRFFQLIDNGQAETWELHCCNIE